MATEDPKKTVPSDVVQQIKQQVLLGAGYRQPPVATRFKKGQSGNPAGRPRRQIADEGRLSPVDTLVLKEAKRTVAIREGEERKEITAIEAVHRAQYVSATKGNAHAQKHILERYERAERIRIQQAQEETDYWRDYIREHMRIASEAERSGQPAPVVYPNPLDIVIDNEDRVWFLGPCNEREAKVVDEIIKLRDAFIIQDAFDFRQSDPLSASAKAGTAMAFALILQDRIPKRLRLTDSAIEMRMCAYDVMPKRHLVKAVRAAWRDVGIDVQRGWTSPPLHVGKAMIEHLANWLDGQFPSP